jgi:hypothetical protein
MVIHEELLDFALEAFAQIIDALDVRVTVIATFDRHDAVVAFPLLLRALFALDHADHPTGELATGEGRFIHEDEHIERVAIVRQGGRHKAKVVREGHSGGQNLAKLEDALLGVVGVFVAAAFGGLDNDGEVRILRLKGPQPSWIGETSGILGTPAHSPTIGVPVEVAYQPSLTVPVREALTQRAPKESRRGTGREISLGGAVVALIAAIVKPKSFAGLFGAGGTRADHRDPRRALHRHRGAVHGCRCCRVLPVRSFLRLLHRREARQGGPDSGSAVGGVSGRCFWTLVGLVVRLYRPTSQLRCEA